MISFGASTSAHVVWNKTDPMQHHLIDALVFVILALVVTQTGARNQLPIALTAAKSSSSPESFHRIRYRARVAYDGSLFNGFQFQPNSRTIQGEIEEVLSRRFGRTVRIVGAGRTDAGVHARGQAIHFDLCPGELDNDEKALERSMNSMLPRDIRVWNLGKAPPPVIKPSPTNGTLKTFPWHVIYNSNQKLYSYRLCTAPSMDPLERHMRTHVDWGNLDMHHLADLLTMYEGTHDFRAFAGAIEQKEKLLGQSVSTVRSVYKAELVQEGEGLYRVDFLLNGALYKMVRNMMGTSIEVCRGRVDVSTFCQLLHHERGANGILTSQFVRDDNPCKPAPPQGLTLERVFYDGDF